MNQDTTEKYLMKIMMYSSHEEAKGTEHWQERYDTALIEGDNETASMYALFLKGYTLDWAHMYENNRPW